MPTPLENFRAQHPEYNDMPDTALADALYRKFYSDMPRQEFDAKMFPNNTDLNRARVVGTGAVEELTNIARLPYQAAQGIDWLIGKIGGPETKKAAEERRAYREANVPSIKKFVEEKIGLPTSATEEAKRLGVQYDRPLEAMTEATKMATGTAALGGGKLLTLLSGAGAGAGSLVDQEWGPTIGGLAGALTGAKLASSAARRQAAKAIPSTEQLGKEAADAFDEMRRAGVTVSPQGIAKLDARISADMARQNFRPAIHAQTAKVLKELADDISQGPAAYRSIGFMGRTGIPQPLTFEQLHGFRQVVNEGIKNSVPASADARLLSRIKSKLDDFLSNLTQRDILGGDPVTAAAALKRGTAAYRQYAKSQEIATLLEKARNSAPNFSQTGLDNAIRHQFKQLADNPRRMRLFTPAEQAQIRMIARSTTPMNLLRFFGRMAPKGAMSGAFHGVLTFNNPALGVPLMGALHGARFAATRSRINAEKALEELIRAGRPIQAPPVLPLALPGIGAAMTSGQ